MVALASGCNGPSDLEKQLGGESKPVPVPEQRYTEESQVNITENIMDDGRVYYKIKFSPEVIRQGKYHVEVEGNGMCTTDGPDYKDGYIILIVEKKNKP